MLKVAMIALGGAAGTAMRYGVSVGMLRWLGPSFPFGTLAANVIGSFLLGVLTEYGGEHQILGVDARLVLGTGMMGGFTTYSSFNLETLRLAQTGEPAKAALYLAATVITCLLGGLGGLALARAVAPT